jgi:hypothetical protein
VDERGDGRTDGIRLVVVGEVGVGDELDEPF